MQLLFRSLQYIHEQQQRRYKQSNVNVFQTPNMLTLIEIGSIGGGNSYEEYHQGRELLRG